MEKAGNGKNTLQVSVALYSYFQTAGRFRTGAQFSFPAVRAGLSAVFGQDLQHRCPARSEPRAIGNKIVGFTLAAFVLGLGKVIFFDVTMFIAARILPQVRTLVIRDSFDYVNRHSIAYFTQEMSGNISNKVTQLNTGVLDGFNEFMMSTSMVMYVLIAIGILSFMNVWFFAAMMLWLALIVLVTWKLGQKRSALSRETSRQGKSLANGVIVDSLANYSEIKALPISVSSG